MPARYIIGPFAQIVTMERLRACGPLFDDELVVRDNAAIVVNDGLVEDIVDYGEWKRAKIDKVEVEGAAVALPSFVDAHTHICWAGSRAADYASRLAGKSYQQIAKGGGGIADTVQKTRQSSLEELVELMLPRCRQLLKQGVTTCEVKSGYGLTVADELKMLRAIKMASERQPVQLIPTCLAAHIVPKEYENEELYLKDVVDELLPAIRAEELSDRVDIFVEENAFSVAAAEKYLSEAHNLGFKSCVHADQFTVGGSRAAAHAKALTADHLEVSGEEEARLLRDSGVAAVVLPGASLGLGIPFAPARLLLDVGLSLVIASDWNPGSAPMGQLLTLAALLGANQKLTNAETFAAITGRAARALQLQDRGILTRGRRADLVVFPTDDYREILYHQGQMNPIASFIKGV